MPSKVRPIASEDSGNSIETSCELSSPPGGTGERTMLDRSG